MSVLHAPHGAAGRRCWRQAGDPPRQRSLPPGCRSGTSSPAASSPPPCRRHLLLLLRAPVVISCLRLPALATTSLCPSPSPTPFVLWLPFDGPGDDGDPPVIVSSPGQHGPFGAAVATTACGDGHRPWPPPRGGTGGARGDLAARRGGGVVDRRRLGVGDCGGGGGRVPHRRRQRQWWPA